MAFSGSRTYHRMTSAIEDAGFEIRDQIMWVYAQGFPKSLNVSKAIAKQTGIGLCTCPVPQPDNMINKLGGINGQEINIDGRNEKSVRDDDGYIVGKELGSGGKYSNEVATQTQHSNLQNETSTKENTVLAMRSGNNEKIGIVSSVEKSVLLDGMCESIPENTRFGDTSLRGGLEENKTRSSESGHSMSSMQPEIGQGVRSASPSSVSVRREKYDGQSNMLVSQLPQHSGEENGKTTFNNTNEDRIKKWNIDSRYICPKCNNIREDLGGTALKPAHEPICVARKPIEGTVAANVLKWGTGAINIDASRVPLASNDPLQDGVKHDNHAMDTGDADTQWGFKAVDREAGLGRFPANLIHDGSEEVVKLFPQSKGQQGDVKGSEPSHTGDENANTYGEYKRVAFTKRKEGGKGGMWSEGNGIPVGDTYLDSGSAARFFYSAKASKSDRNAGLDDFEEKAISGDKGNGIRRVCNKCGAYQLEPCNCTDNEWVLPSNKKNNHPTVKPTELMKYLCRLVTPKGGTVLDPFMGSGSTGKGAMLEGFNFIGIEMTDEYIPIAEARIKHAQDEVNKTAHVDNLFDFDDENT